MGFFLITVVKLLVNVITLAIIVNVLLSYVISPYHPVREALNRFIEPLLAPIRRYIPPAGGIDFSPMVLLIAVQIIGQILIVLFQSF